MFSESDRSIAEARGVGLEEMERQVRLLCGEARRIRLVRPCTLGDGLVVLPEEEHAELLEHHARAGASGRCRKFVPASGAASRMFAGLLHYLGLPEEPTDATLARDLESGSPYASSLETFLERLEEFPFREPLRQELERTGGAGEPLGTTRPIRRVLEAVLVDPGLGLAELPKGLLPFHRYPGEVRTSFEEHLVEGAASVADRDGNTRLHLTISPEHEGWFRERLESIRQRLESGLGCRFEISFSGQSPSTDTVALGPDGEPFRLASGDLLFRASGHGALLENLGALDADLVLLKNIDNVAPDRLKEPTGLWSRLLLGAVARLQRRIHEACRGLEHDPTDATALGAADELVQQLHPSDRPRSGEEPGARLLRLLDRPLRLCGMVPNEGEPGGGPFWVEEPEGESLQIVESAQIDPESPAQARIFASGTHFNPVFLACALRDHRGRPFDLPRYVDSQAVIVARKSHQGRDLLALERPGLWNGAMACWNTVFVEVPATVFHPVKTILDLLRPEHLP